EDLAGAPAGDTSPEDPEGPAPPDAAETALEGGPTEPDEAPPRAQAASPEQRRGSRTARERREAPQQVFTPRHPFDDLSDSELEELVTGDRPALSSLSGGLPNKGRHLHAVQHPDC